MQLVIGVFTTQDQAEEALVRLRQAGYSQEQMALVDNVREGDSPGEPAATGQTAETPDAAARGKYAADQSGSSVAVLTPTQETASAGTTVATPRAASQTVDTPRAAGASEAGAAPDTAESADTGDTAGGPPQQPTTSPETDQSVENAALGAAIGVIAGGAIGGPLGIVIGGAAGGGIAGWLARRRAAGTARQSFVDELGRGRYLLAVEVNGPPAEVHNLLDEAGATQVKVEPM